MGLDIGAAEATAAAVDDCTITAGDTADGLACSHDSKAAGSLFSVATASDQCSADGVEISLKYY